MKQESLFSRLGIQFLYSFLIALVALQLAHGQLREIENKIPEKVPLKIEVKNYDSENWVHEIEIVITNTSKKPIYFLFLNLGMDVRAQDGNIYGWPFIFGNGELYGKVNSKPRPEDPFISPAEVYTFRIEKRLADAWDHRKTDPLTAPFYEEPRKGELELGWLYYGDGSGFHGGGVPFGKKR